MGFELRPLTATDVPALQRLYDRQPAAFRLRLGQPAPPDQAARDYTQASATPGRYQFAVVIDQALTGIIDCKLDDDLEGRAHIGLLLLLPPYDDPAVGGLALRVLGRWLAAACGVRRVETSVVAHDPQGISFWLAQGFEFTGEQYRRELPGFTPRFLVMAKELALD